MLDHSAELSGDSQSSFEETVRALWAAIATAERDFDPTAEQLDVENLASRWHKLDELVNRLLRRAVAEAGSPANPQAEFALHGAGAVVGYYDHAVYGDETRVPSTE